jgi:ActR/RegA family two-component response regulator
MIILTGHGSEQAARERVALGAYDYLTKPCDLDDLVKKSGKPVSHHPLSKSSVKQATDPSTHE